MTEIRAVGTSFDVGVELAAANVTAGAVGVIIFNEGQEGRTETINGTLGGPGVIIPTIFVAADRVDFAPTCLP